MRETNSPSVAHVGYDISPLSKVKFNSLEWRNILTHGQLKENLYFNFACFNCTFHIINFGYVDYFK
jgi:hypothetical protein